jgi:hypothetical protein
VSALVSPLPILVIAVGIAAFRAGWRCLLRPEKAGLASHPAAGAGALAFIVAMGWPLARWAWGAVQGSSVTGPGNVLIVIPALVLMVGLYAPLLAYHAGELLGRGFSTVSQPPADPEDPLERAVAAESRGDVPCAIERYLWLLEREPLHLEARTRLVLLLAATRRLKRALEVLDAGLGLDAASDEARSEWRALKEELSRALSSGEGLSRVVRGL